MKLEKQTKDQDLLQFSLGELPMLRRLCMRVQLQFSRKDRARLAELQDASRVLAGANSPYGWIAFQANLAVRLKRLVIIDLLFALLFVGLVTAAVYSVRSLAPEPCAVTPPSSGSK